MMQRSRTLLIVILGLLTALGPLATDIYLPAFEEIADHFAVPMSAVALSLSSFFIGLAVGQIIYGPLLERYGRKKPMYVGILIYILASAGCALATSVNMLIGFRFLQAVGACGGMVSSRAMVRDLFEGKEVARIFSLLMMVLAVSPILAPTLGGIISSHYSWRYVFFIITGVAALVLLIAVLFLPESRSANADHSMKLNSIFRNYLTIFKNSYFIVYAIVGAAAYSGVYAYVSGSPYLYLEVFDVTRTQYSIIFAVIAAGLIGATQLNNLLLRWMSSERLISVALIFQCGIALILLVFHFLGLENTILTTGLITGYMGCLGFIFPNASSLAMSQLRHTAGNASALLGFVQMVIGAIASAIVSVIQTDGSLALFVVLALCAGVGQLLLSINARRIVPEPVAAHV